jgi:hypothetical protein
MHIVHSTLAPSCILELNLAEGVMQPVFCSSFHFSCRSLISKQPHINHYRGLQYHSKLSCGLTTNLLLYVGKEMTSQDSVAVLLAMDQAHKQTTGVHIQHN